MNAVLWRGDISFAFKTREMFSVDEEERGREGGRREVVNGIGGDWLLMRCYGRQTECRPRTKKFGAQGDERTNAVILDSCEAVTTNHLLYPDGSVKFEEVVIDDGLMNVQVGEFLMIRWM